MKKKNDQAQQKTENKNENNNFVTKLNNIFSGMWTSFKIFMLFLLFIFVLIIIFAPADDNAILYNTAVIPINGVITTGDSAGLFSEESAGSSSIVKLIEEAKNDPSVEAVIFEINSPGGSPVATDEIANAVRELNEEGIVTVAWIRESGASGAYWIASSTDHIVANRMSVVGSIGVYGSYVEVNGLLNRYNMTYRRLVAGEYKDAGSPLKKLTPSEEDMIQEKLDKLHVEFITAVAENRDMPYDDVEELATGEIFLGLEAIDNGLIDETGGKEEVIEYIESQLNITVSTKYFSTEKSFIESLASAMNKNSYYIGRGISSGMMIDKELKITT